MTGNFWDLITIPSRSCFRGKQYATYYSKNEAT